jgi:hypothetical protein
VNTGDCSLEVTGLAVYVLVGRVNSDAIVTLLKVLSIFDRRNVLLRMIKTPIYVYTHSYILKCVF